MGTAVWETRTPAPMPSECSARAQLRRVSCLEVGHPRTSSGCGVCRVLLQARNPQCSEQHAVLRTPEPVPHAQHTRPGCQGHLMQDSTPSVHRDDPGGSAAGRTAQQDSAQRAAVTRYPASSPVQQHLNHSVPRVALAGGGGGVPTRPRTATADKTRILTGVLVAQVEAGPCMALRVLDDARGSPLCGVHLDPRTLLFGVVCVDECCQRPLLQGPVC